MRHILKLPVSQVLILIAFVSISTKPLAAQKDDYYDNSQEDYHENETALIIREGHVTNVPVNLTTINEDQTSDVSSLSSASSPVTDTSDPTDTSSTDPGEETTTEENPPEETTASDTPTEDTTLPSSLIPTDTTEEPSPTDEESSTSTNDDSFTTTQSELTSVPSENTTDDVTDDDDDNSTSSQPSIQPLPTDGSVPTWSIVTISILISFAAIFTGLYYLRIYLIKKRRDDQKRLLRGSVSSEGFFYGDGSGSMHSNRFHDTI